MAPFEPGGAGIDPNPNQQPEWDVTVLDSTSLKNLTQDEKIALLQNCEYLYGVRTDRVDGPISTTRPVARHKPGSTPCVREINDVIAEIINTNNDRETNYVHQGWSLPAVMALPPGTTSQADCVIQSNPGRVRITKRVIVQRLTFLLSLEDLEPSLEFEAAIGKAMEKSTTAERFQALYQVLRVWGDVLPLEFDVGISLSFTDSEANMAALPGLGTYSSINDLLAIKTARMVQRGIDSNDIGSADGKGLVTKVPPLQWRRVRIITAVPLTDILGSKLKQQLLDLYCKRISYHPPRLNGPRLNCTWLDDNQHMPKVISSVVIFGSEFVERITINYRDGTQSNNHGSIREQTVGNVFTVTNHEHITEMLVWSDSKRVHGIQFVTSMGTVSPHYGGTGGTPKVAKSPGGVLAGLSTMSCWDKDQKDFQLIRVTGIWCHDVLSACPKEEDAFSDYCGVATGVPFNDRELIGNSSSMYISSVIVHDKTPIDSLQFKYVDNQGGKPVISKTVRHGVPNGSEKAFVLESGEHIISVTGKHNTERIVQLGFVTDTGRVSQTFGSGDGTSFKAASPQDKEGKRMRLQYICGKSDNYLNGLTCCWAPL